MEFSGLHALVLRGGTCPKSSASGRASTDSSDDGRWGGLWEDIMDALNQSGVAQDALQMVDSTVIRTHHQAAGASGGLCGRVLAVLDGQAGKRSTG